MATPAEKLPAQEEEVPQPVTPRSARARHTRPRLARFRERSPLLHPRAADALIEATRPLPE